MKPVSMEHVYTNYYLSQIGGGLTDIGPLYSNPRFYQQGRGVGSFLGGIFKYIRPLLYSGLNALKRQTLKAGVNVLNDLGKRPFKDILKQQGKQAVDELTEKGMKKLKKLSEQSGNGTSYTFPFSKEKSKTISDHSNQKSGQLLKTSKRKRFSRKIKQVTVKRKRKISKRKYQDIFD